MAMLLCEIVKRRVHQVKGQRQKMAYMRFEIAPDYQAQVDFAEFQVEKTNGRIEKFYLFLMITGYSRKIYAELIEHCDLPTFLDCQIREVFWRGYSYFCLDTANLYLMTWLRKKK